SAYIVGRFSGAIVGAIRKPVTIAVLDEVIAVVQTGNYATHVAAAIEENRAELDALIVDLIKQDSTTKKFRYVPFHDEIVRMVSDTVFRILNGALADPRVHELISDAIRVSAVDLRANVRASLVEEQRRTR
ncbi:MAG TPA: ion transporter, partial [Nocardioides sp.]|nr:ion transporter [Nocardioides sp.]